MSLRVLRGRDDEIGETEQVLFVRTQITQTLAQLAGEVGFSELQQQLQDGSFIVSHLPEDEGPNFEDFVFKENVESGTGNCLDVTWL
jgi:hypothetical protein